MRTVGHWIAARTTPGDSDRTGPVWNPATREQQAEVVLAGRSDVDQAVVAAAAAIESWSQTSLTERANTLFRFRQLVDDNATGPEGVASHTRAKVVTARWPPAEHRGASYSI